MAKYFFFTGNRKTINYLKRGTDARKIVSKEMTKNSRNNGSLKEVRSI